MKFATSLDEQEFNRQYSDTYFRARNANPATGDGKWRTTYLRGLHNTERNPSACLADLVFFKGADNNTGDSITCPMTDIDVDTSYPETGLYEINGFPFLLERIPNRQWKWGICRTNTAFFPILKSIYLPLLRKLQRQFLVKLPSSLLLSEYHTEDVCALHSIFFPSSDKTVTQALSDMGSSKQFSTVINRDFALSISPSYAGYILWKHAIPFAKVNHNNGNISIKNKAFSQEIMDYLNRSGDYGINCI